MTDNICSICLDTINSDDKYTLECNHIYHTKCIVDWFRKSTGNCPLCNDNPINNGTYNFYSSNLLINERYKLIKRKKYKKNENSDINKAINKIKVLEKEKSEFIKERSNFNKDVQVKSMREKIKYYNNGSWKLEDKIRKEKYKVIAMFPGFFIG